MTPPRYLPQVPKGWYCYTLAPTDDAVRSDEGFAINLCPYWQRTGHRMAKCNLTSDHDTEPMDSTMLWDQVKSCGINETRLDAATDEEP